MRIRRLYRRVTVAIHPARNVWMTGRYPKNAGALGFPATEIE